MPCFLVYVQQLQSVDSFTATTTSKMVMPIDPAAAMMAVALYSLEKEIGQIAEMEKEILSYLELEKESEIETELPGEPQHLFRNIGVGR